VFHDAFEEEPDHEQLVLWYRRTRARTKALFGLLTDEAYYDRPIALRNPIVFYEGHLPAFAVNTLVKLTLGRRGIDERLETLFARGIDPEDETAVKSPTELWPSRTEVETYALAADALFEEHVHNCEAAFTVIEHELMHQETLLYMFHALPFEKKVQAEQAVPANAVADKRVCSTSQSIPEGKATLGQDARYYGWDNEFRQHAIDVPAFEIDSHNVTNGEYAEYVEATGANVPHFLHREGENWFRRGMFALEPMPEHAPVYVTQAEAAAYARWKGKRLPTEAEWHRAASRAPIDGQFDFASFDPVAVGASSPSEYGVYDLYGNGWEWTASLFQPFPGFEPMASYLPYSTDFFDGAHYVMKGASPVTPRELVRPSFRNWFRPHYPYVFATFRCAQ
jgi:formylglycine-generating enzyme required for sulfatase activity